MGIDQPMSFVASFVSFIGEYVTVYLNMACYQGSLY